MTAILISSWFVRRHSASVMNALVLAAAGLADPAEIGAVAAFLASSDSSFMTVSEVAVVSGSVRRGLHQQSPHAYRGPAGSHTTLSSASEKPLQKRQLKTGWLLGLIFPYSYYGLCNTYFRPKLAGREILLNPLGTNPEAKRLHAEFQRFKALLPADCRDENDMNLTLCKTLQGNSSPGERILTWLIF